MTKESPLTIMGIKLPYYIWKGQVFYESDFKQVGAQVRALCGVPWADMEAFYLFN